MAISRPLTGAARNGGPAIHPQPSHGPSTGSAPAMSAASLAAPLRYERIIVLAGVVVISLLSWGYTVWLAADMQAAAMPALQSWSAIELAMLFIMWVVMMVAMMLPSATPMLLMFAKMNPTKDSHADTGLRVALFAAGYLAVWSGFSAAAALAQWIMHAAALLSPQMVSTSHVLGGLLLVGAGVFQWTPLKQRCLAKCRSPLGFLLSEWRPGVSGAFVMGLRHGALCVGCCWALMLLLFVTGVMSVLWIALICAFVMVEKALPAGQWIAGAAGVVLVGCGVWMLFGTAEM